MRLGYAQFHRKMRRSLPWDSFPIDTSVTQRKNRKVRLVRSFEFLAAQGAHSGRVSWRLLREFRMTIMPGSTVQCVNPQCQIKGNWMRAETVGSDQCPLCGETLRHVPPTLMPRFRARPRSAAPRPPMRPR